MPSYVLVWLLFIFTWAENFVIRIGFSALLPSIIDELQLSYTRAGLLASAFFYAYVLMQIPSGLLGDRFGRRRILLLGLLGGALAAGLTGLAGSFATLFLARALTGAFQGSLFSNDRDIVATVTPADRIGLGQGVSFSGPGIGLTFGLVIGGLLLEILPWRRVMMLFGLGPIAAALLIARYVPAASPTASRVPVAQRLGSLFSNGRLCTLALVSLCAIGDQFILATWAPPFFAEVGVVDPGRAGSFSAGCLLAALLAAAASASRSPFASRRRLDRCHSLDLEQEIRVEQALDDDQGAGRKLALEHLAARLRDGREVFQPGDVGRDLHEIREVAAGRTQHAAKVLEHLPGLRAHVALADDVAGRVPRHLSGDVEQPAALHPRRHLVVRHRLRLGCRDRAERHRRSSLIYATAITRRPR